MEYQDFTIDIHSAGRGCFEAKVIDSLVGGGARVIFRRPFEKRALRSLLQRADKRVRDDLRGITDQEGRKPLTALSAREIGQQLFSTLLHGELLALFDRCRDALPRNGRSGMRIRLRFLLSDTEAEYLGALPWEWLWDSRGGTFVATARSTPVVRDFALPAREPLEVKSPLRILVVDGAPATMKQLNLQLEIDRMREALRRLSNKRLVKILHRKKVTPETLRDELLAKEIHVLHFMGHGGYHSASGCGAVFFAKPNGAADQVDGEELADYLKDIPSLRLVVLNACKTARHASRVGEPLYFGVASAILERARVPAVVANQYAISDEAAIELSTAFYGRLAKGDDVGEALTEARLRLKRKSREWATPVLFLSGESGKIFTVETTGNGRPAPPRRPTPAAQEPVRLGIRSIVGWGRDMKDRNDHFLDLADHFKGRFIHRQDDWQDIVFPRLRDFLLDHIDPRRPVLLDFAAHSSIAFAAGWVLEAKSGLDVRVLQRTGEMGEIPWHPDDGSAGEGELWLERPDIKLRRGAPDVALSLAVSQPDVAKHVRAYIRRKGLPVGRIVDAVIAPEPGQRSVRGGAHALRLAQAFLPHLRERRPHERDGCLHLFCAGPNALLFYLGQLSRSLESIALYEFPFGAKGSFGRYQRSIELPPPEEREAILEEENW